MAGSDLKYCLVVFLKFQTYGNLTKMKKIIHDLPTWPKGDHHILSVSNFEQCLFFSYVVCPHIILPHFKVAFFGRIFGSGKK